LASVSNREDAGTLFRQAGERHRAFADIQNNGELNTLKTGVIRTGLRGPVPHVIF